MIHPNQQVHLTYYYFSRCPDCHNSVMKEAYDLGVMKFSDFHITNLKVDIKPIFCKKCWEDTWPQELLLKDQLSNKILYRKVIGQDIEVEGDGGDVYGSVLTKEESELNEIGATKLADTFNMKHDAFWEAYTAYALEKWDRIIRNLTIKEINDALVQLKMIHFHRKESLSELRRDIKKYCQTVKEKKLFWKAVNHELVNCIYLNLPPKDWQVDKDIEIFGLERIYFMVIHFPLPQELELFRLKHICKVIKNPQQETKMLIEGLTKLESEHANLIKRFHSTTRQLQEERASKAKLEEKLFEKYKMERDHEQQRTSQEDRVQEDIQKIKEYKGLISELKVMNNQLLAKVNQDKKDVQAREPLEIDCNFEVIEEPIVDIGVLKGKTIGIIGGFRRKVQEFFFDDCHIMKHSGENLDNQFYGFLKKSDIIVLLTNYVSHAAMWETKEYAIEEGKKIHFVTSTNLKKILEVIVKN